MQMLHHLLHEYVLEVMRMMMLPELDCDMLIKVLIKLYPQFLVLNVNMIVYMIEI